MQPDLSPSDVFRKRRTVLKAMLGAGWLGASWTHAPVQPSETRTRDWVAMERRYGELIRWLGRGLEYVCRQTVHSPVRRGSGAASDGNPPAAACSGGLPDLTLRDPFLSPRDVPVALLHALRRGLLVSPSGVTTSCSVTAGDLLGGVVPFLAWLYCLHDRQMAMPERPARCLVLLAGVPGAGKSVIASVIEEFSLLLKEMPGVQSIGMDGWHLPNRIIQSRKTRDELGWIVPLSTRKGSPESFDVRRLAADLQSLVSDPSPVRLPAYDRTLHEPVDDMALVGAPIVLLEGNYLLLQGQGWEEVRDLASGAAWLDVPLELSCRSMLNRHMTVGRTHQEAEEKWAVNDGPNSLLALRGRHRADATLHLDAFRQMRFVHRLHPASD